MKPNEIMLELRQVVKDYSAGDSAVRALDEISLAFRKNEFVSVLGPSGCGKTTLLNIIGGLDHYTSGDLLIDGVSTRLYRERDWDTYRNHSIGFVFQSYNLIPHQTVLANVELALTLSGVSKAERRRRAAEALEKVGLGNQLKKKPSQLSGGQMQRVAIARALVNDPEILLADEPTGALDTATSIQVMDLLREIAEDRLVIMVTHNPELAEKYSTRIVRLLDGRVVDDTDPCEASADGAEAPKRTRTTKEEAGRKGKRSMSPWTAASLSLRNLLTKKTRTFLTSFAGSIGIIGIALILALSNGIELYIQRVQEDTLSTYPISLTATTQDYSSLLSAMTDAKESTEARDTESRTVYVDDSMASMISAMYSTTTNDLKSFKAFLEANRERVDGLVSDVQYTYDFDLQIYSGDGKTRINPTTIFDHMDGAFASMVEMMKQYSASSQMFSQLNVFSQMLDNDTLLQSQYELADGVWATEADQVMLVVDSNNAITNMVAYILGLEDQEGLSDAMNAVLSGKEYHSEKSSYSFDDFLGMTFYVVPNNAYYRTTGNTYTAGGTEYPVWTDVRNDPDYDQAAFARENGVAVTVCGIIRPAAGAIATSISGAVAYRSSLGDRLMSAVRESDVARQQAATPEVDVFTGLPFVAVTYTKAESREFLDSLDETSLSMLKSYIAARMGSDPSTVTTPMLAAVLSTLEDDVFAKLVSTFVKSTDATLESNLALIGVVSEDSPSAINLYAKDFESKDALQELIDEYNDSVDDAKKITYVDMIGIFLSGITTIIDVISYVLIAFVSISLVVSSIMIGIITYISVLERIREIGVLRAIGASRRDISRVFNSETLIVGLCAGLIGVAVTNILCLPINAIIRALSGITGVNAVLPWYGYLLVVLSMVLTYIAGLIPAGIASKKDPVVALRTE